MPRTKPTKKTLKKDSAVRSPARTEKPVRAGAPSLLRGQAKERASDGAPVRLEVPEEILSAPDTALSALEKETEPSDEALARRASARDRYFEAVGRRKTAVARARLFTKAGDFTVNGKPYGAYFPTPELQRIAEDALKKMKLWERFRVSIKVSGGGSHSQAEALRHALARCLIKFNPDFRKRLKRAGYLRRDPRAKERKKFGLKKARRAPQWQKR